MTLTDTVKADLISAMKAGEKERVGALRLVLSELQKATKEGVHRQRLLRQWRAKSERFVPGCRHCSG